MFIYNDIGNLFFIIVNNISYNKIEVEKIVDSYPIDRFTNRPIDRLKITSCKEQDANNLPVYQSPSLPVKYKNG